MNMAPTFHDHFSTASDAYRNFRPNYPEELFAYLATLCPARDWAWDCGCGNGQASVALARYFARVSATDASAEQIQQAQPAPNVYYKVTKAETIDAPANSLDLISVAQAIHWFDHAAFFSSATRALKPGGILAAWGYQLLYTDTDLDDAIAELHQNIVGPYWPAERSLLDDGYTRINFPFEAQSTPKFFMRAHWNFEHLLGYLNTWSAVKRFEQACGQNPLHDFLPRLKAGWGDIEQSRDVYWPLILYVGCKM